MGVADRLRRLRRDQPRAAEEGPLPTVAVLTVARDEADMLPRWVRYYGDQVGVENLIVFDDNSVDGGTDDLPCTVHRIPGFPPGKFEGARMRLVSGVAQGLLQTYDVVVFTDVDEFIVADPARHESLRHYLRARPGVPVMAPLGLNLVHHTGAEGPLDPSRPLLGQRRFATFVPVMCKPAMKRVPAAWAAASHGIRTDAPYLVDPEVLMLHLKFADRDTLAKVAAQRHAMVQVDGRAKSTTWSNTGDEMAAQLDALVAGVDPATVPEFDPYAVDVSRLVVEGDRCFRAPREGQLHAMRRASLVRVPDRMLGIL